MFLRGESRSEHEAREGAVADGAEASYGRVARRRLGKSAETAKGDKHYARLLYLTLLVNHIGLTCCQHPVCCTAAAILAGVSIFGTPSSPVSRHPRNPD